MAIFYPIFHGNQIAIPLSSLQIGQLPWLLKNVIGNFCKQLAKTPPIF